MALYDDQKMGVDNIITDCPSALLSIRHEPAL